MLNIGHCIWVSIDLSGTPAKIGWKEEKLSFILTENFRLERNEVRESSR